jgi:hypothetical protein
MCHGLRVRVNAKPDVLATKLTHHTPVQQVRLACVANNRTVRVRSANVNRWVIKVRFHSNTAKGRAKVVWLTCETCASGRKTSKCAVGEEWKQPAVGTEKSHARNVAELVAPGGNRATAQVTSLACIHPRCDVDPIAFGARLAGAWLVVAWLAGAWLVGARLAGAWLAGVDHTRGLVCSWRTDFDRTRGFV